MQARVVFVVALLVACVAAFTEDEYKTSFSNWVQQYGKVYTNDEFLTRYNIFKYNMDFVQKWNADSTHTHTVALNSFADLSLEEYSKIYLGTHIDGTQALATAGPFETYNLTSDVINWASKGAVTPIKNQGQCGSCYTFSTTGSVEGINQIKTGNLISLSEQNLLDCTQDAPYKNEGCNGGSMDACFQYIINNKGIDREADYPYTASAGSCHFKTSWTGATIGSYTDVQSGNENALASAVNAQPVSVAIDASHSSFQLYHSGIYYEAQCSSSRLDHGVLAIGYGSDNGDYWIVKNSWGTSWGMEGYIWMSRNRNNNCGIATMASRPLAA